MIFISHRGNTNGPDPDLENHPIKINALLKAGINVEVDIWYIDGQFYYGHDAPFHKVSEIFLKAPGLWFHAKNLPALYKLLQMGLIVFWHQEDNFTLTSNGFIWTFPEMPVTDNSIIVNLKKSWKEDTLNCFGVCSDYY